MSKKRSNLFTLNCAISQIFLLVLMIIASAFIIGQNIESVLGAQNPINTAGYGIGKGTEIIGKIYGGKVFKPKGEIYYGEGYKTYGWGGFGNSLIAGLAWGITAYFAAKFLSDLFGADKSTSDALALAAGAGAFTSGFLASGLFQDAFWGTKGIEGFLAGHPFLTGIVVAAVVFAITYKEETIKIVDYQCMPYEPPLGGRQCEECNKDPFRPCSEYRCKSLGQACELLNKGTNQERCAWVSKFDVESPIITPWKDALYPKDLNYIKDTNIRPPALGVKIVKGNDGCLQAFTPLQFGFVTNEPAQCKIDYINPMSKGGTGRERYDSMQFYFGETNYYQYNHTQKIKLPGPDKGDNAFAPELGVGGTFSFYVMCQDSNGNLNEDVYVFTMCIDQSPDTTPPVIEKTSIENNSPVRYQSGQVPIVVYVNEPAECKWSIESKDYDEMENIMNCDTKAYQINAEMLYACYGNLTGIKDRTTNKYYFRCRDQPGKPSNERFTMVQSYELLLRGSQPLNILKVTPNETQYGSSDAVTVNLEVETDDGSDEGKAICYFSPTGIPDSYVRMFETGDFNHKQTLLLTPGSYKYYIRCIDAGGNAAEKTTSFRVFSDTVAPIVTRTYKDSANNALKIITNEKAICTYSFNSCNFVFDEGLAMSYINPEIKDQHYAEWKSAATYYIKCRDLYGNEPLPNKCSIVVKSVQISQNA